MKEEEFVEVDITSIQDKMTLRRLISEWNDNPPPQSVQSHSVDSAQGQGAVQSGDEEEEEKERVPEPSVGAVRLMISFGFHYIFQSGKIKSGDVRKKLADNTNREPFFSVKKYIPPPHSIQSKKYKYSPKLIIRANLQHAAALKLVELYDVVCPGNDVEGKHWHCKFRLKSLQSAWNESSPEERRVLYDFIKVQSIQNGGLVDWERVIGVGREPLSVNEMINFDQEPDLDSILN